ncbi:uncharacterized protein V6R79_001623 [Siganus canaliculatus]
MKTIYLLLLVALTGLAESRRGHKKRSKRELLVRTKRRWVLSTIELQEEDPGPYPKEISQMYNDKSGDHHEFRISGMGVDVEPLNVFSIDPHTGLVYAHRSIDRELYPRPFHIKFDIYDKWHNNALDRELAFDVEVKDINDNAPVFANTQLTVDVKENNPPGYLPVQLLAMDRDQENTSNSEITIKLISQSPQDPKISVKQLDGRLAQLMYDGCFDYDEKKKYEVVVQANDHGKPSLSTTAVVTLNIVDANTHPPTFKEREYEGQVSESVLHDDVLRIAVDDKDTPHTPGWRAKYFFIKGNDGGNYKIETDPVTNEGILSVIKGKDFERTSTAVLQIGVENEEPLYVCKAKSAAGAKPPAPDSITVKISVIDINDPPEFLNSPFTTHQKEEQKPGVLLYTPKIRDVDSDPANIRYMLLEDPANWVSIDTKTGQLRTTKSIDRESPILNGTDTYQVIICAIDDGNPPGTATGTVHIHLMDINDNVPKLINKHVTMCGNKNNKVKVPVEDLDGHPFSGPFFFSLDGEDETLRQRFKLEPSVGMEGGLVCPKALAYGNYSVPLLIEDQQNSIGHNTLEVIVCDCGKGDTCLSKAPATSSLGPGAIGLLFAGILLFLLLLFVFVCQRGNIKLKPMMQEEGNQTLIKYNEEGGASECLSDPTLFLTPTNSVNVIDGLKKGNVKTSQMAPVMAQDMDMYKSSGFNLMNSNETSLGWQTQRNAFRSEDGQAMYSTWNANRSSAYQGRSYNHSVGMWSNYQVADQLEKRLNMVDGSSAGQHEYRPHEYVYEGQGSKCQSLDQLSVSNMGDDLTFLNDLGPRFTTLEGICHQSIREKNLQL